MANPWRIAAIGTTISICGWFLSPIISLLVNKIISYVTLDSSAKLRSLKIQTVPELKRLLREAEEQKALSAERRGNAGDVARLDDVLKDVRSALHLADDILDLVEYHRHEKKAVTGRDRLSSWISWLFAAAGACVARCDGRSRLGRRCGGGEPARWLLRAAVGPCISRSRSAAAVLPTRRPRLVGSSLGRGRRWRDSVLTSPRKMVQAACSCRRCFCDTVATLFGTSYQQEIGSESSYTVPGFSRIRLKKLLKKIEKLINEAEKTLGLGNLPRKNRNGDHITNITAKYIGKPSTANPPLKVTGRDENRDHLISMLHATEHNDSPSSSDATCYSLVGIHGIPGSGKTTLAQYICESEKNASYFDLVMWVHVTQNFTVDTIYREMFEAASGDRKPCPSYNSLDVLQSNLEEKLRGKRFLLVLDDIWRDKDSHGHKLEQLLYPLKVGKRGSKILVTSRSADALSDLGLVRVEHFEIPELRCDDFLQLFMFCALGDMPVDNRDIRIFEVIGAEIAKKLKGSPLAATIVGRRLRRHRDIKYWMEFNSREHLDDVVRNLCWSFQHFDEETRQCFAYCSIFPRRYQLERDELVKLWVAQGIITRTNGEEKEDAAQRCFHDLVSASFLRPGYDYYSRQRFTIHDLLHDLAKNVAGSDCFTIEKDGSGNVPSDVCHLFIQSYDGTDLSKVFSQSSNMRTMIIIHTEDTKRLCVEEVFGCVSTLTKLRALILKVEVIRLDYSENVSVPESIGRLKHLRYLAFGKPSCERIILPCTFAQLYHMEMLDVKPFTSLAFSSGEDTGNLINLRDLVSSKDLDAPYIGTLESLRTLKHFPVRKGKGYELSQLKKLNKLGGTISIDGLENVASREDALDAKLHRKVFLREVKLSWRANSRANAEEQDLQSDVLEALCPPVQIQALKIAYYKGSRYPSWMTMGDPHIPMCLRDLTLFCCSELGPIPTHSELFSHLRTLHICYCGQNSLPDSMENLVSLIELEIKGFWGIASLPTLPRSLKELTVDGCWEITSFPTLPWTLEKLTIDGCLKVNSLPRTMPPNMVFFTLSSCHCDFVRSCETVGHENWEKIRHIRDRIIRYKPPPDDISSSEDCGDDE